MEERERSRVGERKIRLQCTLSEAQAMLQGTLELERPFRAVLSWKKEPGLPREEDISLVYLLQPRQFPQRADT